MTEPAEWEIPHPGSRVRCVILLLRTRLFELLILLWSLPFGIVILTYFQLRRKRSEVRWALRRWSTGFIATARAVLGVRYRVEGLEHIPDEPVIYVANHQSYWESIAFTALIPDINVITKAEAMRIPVFGWGLREAPMTPVFRDQKGRNLRRIIRESKQSIAAGRSVLLFPEGTRVKPGETKPFLRGLELLYASVDARIVPVANNAGAFWTEGFRIKSPGEITIRFCPHIDPGSNPRETASLIERTLNDEKDRILSHQCQLSTG